MQHINQTAADQWNTRVSMCIKEKWINQQSFAKAYKDRYGSGSQADVSRWSRVGGIVSSDGKQSVIGFPAYDTMKRIADLLNVSVGYLTGETDFRSYDTEKACSYLGITEEAASGIQAITAGKSIFFLDKYLKKEYGAALCFLLSSSKLKEFIERLCELAEAVNRQKHPVNHWNRAIKKIKPDLVDKAIECWQYPYWEDMNWIESEEHPAPSQELLNAIALLEKAAEQDMNQPLRLESNVKLSKYALFEIYLKLIDDIIRDEHLEQLTMRLMEEMPSIKEIKRRVAEDD